MNEPDWSCLPQRPLQFFGLSPEFSRKDLKRAYNGFIRRYKPDRAPQGFQRIRAAYETLERWLKFREDEQTPHLPYAIELPPETSPEAGNTQRGLQFQPSSPWQFSDPQTPPARGHSSPPAETVAKILARLSPAAWFAELQARPRKTAQDYVRLAFLCDLDGNRDHGTFLDWLSRGLREFPDDRELLQLVYHYCREEIPNAELASVLHTLCPVLSPRIAFSYLQPVWFRLLRHDYPEFRRLWRIYLHAVRDEQAHLLVPFLAEQLPGMQFVADQNSLDETWIFIKAHPELLDAQHDYCLELSWVLRKYILHYHKIRREEPGRFEQFAPWHNALREFCLAVSAKDRERFAAFQRNLVATFSEWSKSFPDDSSSAYAKQLARTWEWVAAGFREPGLTYPTRLGDHQANEIARAWLGRIRSPWPRRFRHGTLITLRFLGDLLFAVGIAFTLTLCLGMWRRLPVSNAYPLTNLEWFELFVMINAFVSIPAVIFYGWQLKRRMIPELNRRDYLRCYRLRAAWFFRQTRITYRQFQVAMDDWLVPQNASPEQIIIGNQMLADPALILLSAALDFDSGHPPNSTD